MLKLPHRTFRILLILSLFIAMGTLLLLYLSRSQPAPIMVDTLSPRAQEFITDQTSDGSGLWNQMQLGSTPSANVIAGQTPVRTDCFSFVPPWKITNPQFESSSERCTWRAKTIAPLSHLVVSTYISTSFSEDSGIVLRREETGTYRETVLKVPGFSQVSVFRSPGNVIIFALQTTYMITLTFNDLSPSVDISNQEITDILKTFSSVSLPTTEVTAKP